MEVTDGLVLLEGEDREGDTWPTKIPIMVAFAVEKTGIYVGVMENWINQQYMMNRNLVYEFTHFHETFSTMSYLAEAKTWRDLFNEPFPYLQEFLDLDDYLMSKTWPWELDCCEDWAYAPDLGWRRIEEREEMARPETPDEDRVSAGGFGGSEAGSGGLPLPAQTMSEAAGDDEDEQSLLSLVARLGEQDRALDAMLASIAASRSELDAFFGTEGSFGGAPSTGRHTGGEGGEDDDGDDH
ncbi:hypothetical protein BJ875DRAFT_546235 [Amylocarpus encephaloides]|uniref:Uncharacterized protein n=1 Tax=Amylocarpus encephaloides TaxID=45428 RepID=A0A9P7YBQ7_9HELO|nr:hypothetical protein BJ875DRAFT_546235 [Amylocarpus encephaloides]